MKVLLAMDSFKGCATSLCVEQMMAEALRVLGHEVRLMPMSDGGDGMLDSFADAMGADRRSVETTDPLGRPIMAQYAVEHKSQTAIIETAQACGLCTMRAEERNPLIASTAGVGRLILDAMGQGCKNFIVGLGGSGTSDAGQGMLRLLANELKTENMNEEEEAFRNMAQKMGKCNFTLASDVDNPLCGPKGAARVFGPQKGATPEMVETLDQRAREFAEGAKRLLGYDRSSEPGAGAAGGLGYAFMQFCGARARSGAEILMELTHFDDALAWSDVVITGEGASDRQTLMGKLPWRVMERARELGRQTWLVSGLVREREALEGADFGGIWQLKPKGMSTEEAMRLDVLKINIERWCDVVNECHLPH